MHEDPTTALSDELLGLDEDLELPDAIENEASGGDDRGGFGGAGLASSADDSDAETLEDVYFREMGAIPLAKREGELRLAAGIERARTGLAPLLEHAPTVVGRVLGKGFAAPRGTSMEETLPERVGQAVLADVTAVLARGTHRDQPLPAKDRRRLARYRDDLTRVLADIDEAKRLLTEANLRLVIHIAKRYRRHQMPMLDLVQEGNIGLMKAVERYRADTGFRFSTYASWWIHQYIRRSIDNQGALVRIPLYLQEERRKIARTSRDLGLELGRAPRPEEIAERAGEDAQWVEDRLAIRGDAVSLDAPLGDDGRNELGDLIADGETPSPFESASSEELAARVKEALGALTPREAKIVALRFGVGEISAHSLQEISVRFRLTRERIRQIEAQALKSLREVFVEKGIAGAA